MEDIDEWIERKLAMRKQKLIEIDSREQRRIENVLRRRERIKNATNQKLIENAARKQKRIENAARKQKPIENSSRMQGRLEFASSWREYIENALREQKYIENALPEQKLVKLEPREETEPPSDKFEVAAIVDHRGSSAIILYRVRWAGEFESPEHDTWEPQSNLFDEETGQYIPALSAYRRRRAKFYEQFKKERRRNERNKTMLEVDRHHQNQSRAIEIRERLKLLSINYKDSIDKSSEVRKEVFDQLDNAEAELRKLELEIENFKSTLRQLYNNQREN